MISPESIDLSALPFVALSERNLLPVTSGIYFAIDANDCIQYIGIARGSDGLNGRWKSTAHHRYRQLEKMGSVRLAYIEVDPPELLLEIEDALVCWFQPPLNKSPVPDTVDHPRDPHEKLNARVRAGNTKKLREIAFRLGFRRNYGGIEIGSIGFMLDAMVDIPIEKLLAIKVLLGE